MRTRTQIEVDGARKDILALEVLLDLRDLLKPKEEKRKRGRPRKQKGGQL